MPNTDPIINKHEFEKPPVNDQKVDQHVLSDDVWLHDTPPVRPGDDVSLWWKVSRGPESAEGLGANVTPRLYASGHLVWTGPPVAVEHKVDPAGVSVDRVDQTVLPPDGNLYRVGTHPI